MQVFQWQVDYLGYTIDQNGSQHDPKKVVAVRHWPRPTTVTGVRPFLAFCNYHTRFVKDFAQIAEPLTNLMTKNQTFTEDENCEAAFESLMKAFTTA